MAPGARPLARGRGGEVVHGAPEVAQRAEASGLELLREPGVVQAEAGEPQAPGALDDGSRRAKEPQVRGVNLAAAELPADEGPPELLAVPHED